MASEKARAFSIEQLLRQESFPHQVTALTLLETHISWVILTGEFAYKIKKPVEFDFVDYSTLEFRRQCCFRELDLNRRFAPDLYLDVLPVCVVDGNLVISDVAADPEATVESDQAVEYAVRMREFSQDAIVAARLQGAELSSESVEQFGCYVAEFHDSIESAIPTLDFVQPELVIADSLENFEVLRDAFDDEARNSQIERLEQWTRQQAARLQPAFARRLNAGLVRRCHGDLHLKNIIQMEGKLLAFDGIEFNEAFQCIDVLSEIAFPVMDFAARGRADLGWRLLNSYLECTSDYRDLDVLLFYLVYRAMVRAKVTWLNPANRNRPRGNEGNLDSEGVDLAPDANAGPWDKYFQAGMLFSYGLKPKLSISFGFSGSGKSCLAMEMVAREGGVRIRSDVVRHQLAREFKIRNEYSSDMTDWVYSRLLEMARSAIEAGFPVVIDATFLASRHRALFQALARELDVDYQIIHCDAPFEELCRRIRERGPDPSEADIDVLKMQMETHDPLTTEELQFVFSPANPQLEPGGSGC